MATRNERRLEVRVVSDATQFNRGLQQAARSTQTFDKQMDTASKTGIGRFNSTADVARQKVIGLGAAIAATFAAGKLIEFGRESIQAASLLEQSIGGTEAVFGDASDAIDRFGETSAESIGLAESEFRTATTSIGGQLKRMTGDVDFAAEQSIRLTEVAADLAATYGGTTAEAVAALGSAFRGEADPAERFNLNLKISEVNAKAVALGLAETTREITNNARAQATIALIMEQSADAQGQFAREADTAAGAQQRLSAQWKDAQAEIGQRLLPVMVDLTNTVRDQLPEMIELASAVAEIASSVVSVGSAISESIGDQRFVNEEGPNWVAILGLDDLKAFIEYGPGERVKDANRQIAEAMRDGGDAVRRATSGYEEIGDTVGSADQAMRNMARRGAAELAEANIEVERSVGNLAAPLDGLVGDLLEAQAAAESLFTVLRSASDPVFAAVSAWQSYQAAVKAANEDGTVDAIENLELLKEEIDLNAALGELGANYDEAMNAIALATNEPIDKVEELFEALGLIDGQTFTTTVETQFVTSGQPATNTGIEVRAHGGRVNPFQPYIVGDAGKPEVFVPDQPGMIHPSVDQFAAAMLRPASGQSVTNNWSIALEGSGDAQVDAQRVGAVSSVLRRMEAR